MVKKRPISKKGKVGKVKKKAKKPFPTGVVILAGVIVIIMVVVGVGVSYFKSATKTDPTNAASDFVISTTPERAKQDNYNKLVLALFNYQDTYFTFPDGEPDRKQHPEWYNADGTPKLVGE